VTSGSKPTSRFLPTLTEIVQPAHAVRAEVSAAGREELAAVIASTVQQNLEVVLAEMVARVMRDEADRAKQALSKELEPLVRRMVAEALEHAFPPERAE